MRNIKLVITVALKKEVPKEWSGSCGAPVHTIEALRAGALGRSNRSGVIIIVTGAGMAASRDSAYWIRDNLSPLFVVNVGTCGLLNSKCNPARWLLPETVSDEKGNRIGLDTRVPFPLSADETRIQSLLSVQKAYAGSVAAEWKAHDAVDMECFAQAQVFSGTGISFHCLKFGTDRSDENTVRDFNDNLVRFQHEAKGLFAFAAPRTADVTVIIPVHDRERSIRSAIDSVLSQSHRPDEIIVVDDCSADGTADVLRSYGRQIRPVHLQENSGPSRARNEGVRLAGTEWVSFLDSDDRWEKNKLSDQIRYLQENPFYQILQSEEIWIRNGVRVNPRRHHKKPEGWIWEQSLERCLVSPSGVLVRKALLEKYGLFDETLPVCEDYDLWLKISRHHPVGLEPGYSVIKYGGHHDQLSRRYPAMDRFRVRSLLNLLQNEEHPGFRQKIIRVLAGKLDILIKGYEKREKREEAEECRGMLESLVKQA